MDNWVDRVRWMEHEIRYHKERIERCDRIEVYFSEKLWTSESTVYDGLTRMRARQDAGRRHGTPSIASTEDHLELSVNKSELLELLLAIHDRIKAVSTSVPLERILHDIWVNLGTSSQQRMEELLPASLVELARQDPCVDILEHRGSPLERVQLPEGISCEEDGWCYGIQSATGERRKHNWIMLFGKRDLFSGQIYFEIKLEGQEGQPYCGHLEEVSRNRLILRLAGGEKKAFDIDEISWARFRELQS
ncbi:MAG: hypothetical protein QM296_11470 [Bacillota bacterium]|nr:hypothetical protein [Bacillota bacterium]